MTNFTDIKENVFSTGLVINDFLSEMKFKKNSNYITIKNEIHSIKKTNNNYKFLEKESTLKIVSTNKYDKNETINKNIGAKKILIYGLNKNYEQISEIINLNGTKTVNSTKLFLRINFVKVIEVGSIRYNIGTIIISVDNILSEILPTNNESFYGIYTVPINRTCFIVSLDTSLYCKSNNTSLQLNLNRKCNNIFYTKDIICLCSNGTSNLCKKYYLPIKIEEKTDIILNINKFSGKSFVNTTILNGILI